jgi:hypothetical protein
VNHSFVGMEPALFPVGLGKYDEVGVPSNGAYLYFGEADKSLDEQMKRDGQGTVIVVPTVALLLHKKWDKNPFECTRTKMPDHRFIHAKRDNTVVAFTVTKPY